MNTKKISLGLFATVLAASVPFVSVGAMPRDGAEGGIAHTGLGAGMRSGTGREDGVRRGMPNPPAASESACFGKSADDSCSFSFSGTGSEKTTTIDGVCRNVPSVADDGAVSLACVPLRKDGVGSRDEKIDSGQARLQQAQRMRETKADQINRIESHIEKIIAFLGTKGIDTASISGELTAFRGKGKVLLDKIDAYIAVLNASGSSVSDISTAHDAVKAAGKDMQTYFHGALRPDIKKAVDSLND